MRGSAVGLLLALLVTAVIFGGAFLVVQVIVPAMMRGESLDMLRWGGVVLIGGFLAYRIYGRLRRRRRARSESELT
jgi:ABC-type nickel/cobalt efflux system permease component RcnA